MIKYLLISLSMLWLNGCALKHAATLPGFTPKNDREMTLVKRHLSYWEAMSEKEFETSYSYELPHLRFQKDLAWYKEFHNKNLSNYKIFLKEIIMIDDERAIVRSTFKDKAEETSNIEDRWVFVDGKWYHYFTFHRMPDRNKPF